MKTNNQTAIISYIEKNPKSSNAQIVSATGINRETVRITVNKLVASGILSAVKENNKSLFSKKVSKPAPARKPKAKIITAFSTPTIEESNKKLIQIPALVKTAEGKIGFVYKAEPKVIIKKSQIATEKIIVHAIDKVNQKKAFRMAEDKYELLNTKVKIYKKILATPDSLTFLTQPKVVKPTKAKKARVCKTTGESHKDTSKYVLDGITLNKGRLIHAIIAKFVGEHNPSLKQLAEAFPAKSIHPKLFVSFSEAVRVNTETKHIRFFAKDGDCIRLSDGTVIAVTNQVTGDTVSKMLAVTPTHGIAVAKA